MLQPFHSDRYMKVAQLGHSTSIPQLSYHDLYFVPAPLYPCHIRFHVIRKLSTQVSHHQHVLTELKISSENLLKIEPRLLFTDAIFQQKHVSSDKAHASRWHKSI